MKTRRLFVFAIAVLAFGMLFAGCAQEHEHTWMPATCTTPKTCETCQETEGEPLGHAEEEVVGRPATCSEEGLTNGKKCSVCDEIIVAQEPIKKLHHTEATKAGKAATCTEAGLTDGKYCSVCEEVLVEQETIPAAGHKDEDGNYKCDVCTTNICKEHTAAEAIKENEKAATCTETGSYYSVVKCSKCGEELSREQKTINALGHTEEVVPGKAATCTATGLTDGKKCSVCDEILVEQEEIPTAAHTEEVVPGKAATCTATGLTDGKKCSVCDATLVEQEEIPTAAHTEEVVPGKAATCTEKGLTDGKKCSVCGETLLEQEEIPAAGHKDENGDYECDVCETDLCTDHNPGEAVKENEKAATCTEAGSYDSVVKCSKCGEELSREQKTINALGHTEEVVPGKAATCTATGLTDGKKCTVCGETTLEQEEIPALGHKYGSVVYKWSDDNSTCTASKTCANDAAHVASETATVSTVALNVTATKVTYTYNAQFANGEYAAQTKTVEADVTLANSIATINAPAIAGRVASHDYVKFGFHDAEATYTFTIYYSEVDVWDGTSVSEGLSGTGTATDPYLIQSGADLAYVAKVVNEAAAGTANFKGMYFKMTKSIDLNGNELKIGMYSASQVFHGYFDGNNCSVRNLNNTQSLFGMLKDGYIKNLSTYGTVTTTEKKGVAGILSYISNATIENATNYANVTGVQQTAGIVGYLETNTTTFAKNCVNYGNVNATSYQIGGIAGFAKGSLSDCTNFGDVTSKGDYVGGVGGAGLNAKGSRSNCVNYGNVSGSDYVGGVFGQVNATTTNCHSYGTATGTGKNVGEVVGSGASYLK